MKIIYGIWAILSLLSGVAFSQKKYDTEAIAQVVQYDDDGVSYQNNSPYPQRIEPKLSSYEKHPEPAKTPYYSSSPAVSSYRQPQHPQPQQLYGYYTSPIKYYSSKDYEEDSPESNPPAESLHEKQQIGEIEDSQHDKPVAIKREHLYEQPDELQHSHGADEPTHQHHHSGSGSKYSSDPQYPPPKPHDPKLPLYFTMYEKRVIQDPMTSYGKGPWRYLTYGHGITYGSKEPGKVFERGYGYIRALGRDHCKLPKNLCPPSDEKPFEYEGRKEPYFGYRPH